MQKRIMEVPTIELHNGEIAKAGDIIIDKHGNTYLIMAIGENVGMVEIIHDEEFDMDEYKKPIWLNENIVSKHFTIDYRA